MTINQVNNLESALSVRQKINLTIDKANSVPDNMTATWNNSGEVFTGIKLSITDTASDSESLLMNLFVDGNSQFKVGKDAGIRFGTGAVAGAAGVGLFSLDNTAIAFGQDAGSASWGGIGAGGFVAAQSAYYGWGNSTLAAPDLFLFRDAANTLAQYNGTNAQTFNLYNTYTDASNYERMSLTQSADGFVLDAQYAGTGVEPTNLLDIKNNGVSKFKVDKNGYAYTTRIIKSGNDPSYWSGIEISDTPSIQATNVAVATFGRTGTNGKMTLGGGVTLETDAANTLAQRNGTNAQTFNIYNTYTDASNYERGVFGYRSNELIIGAEMAGNGQRRTTVLAATDVVGSYGGQVDIRAGLNGGPLGTGKSLNFKYAGGVSMQWGIDNTFVGSFQPGGFSVGAGYIGGGSSQGAGIDASIKRVDQYVLGVQSAPSGTPIGNSLEFIEQTAPAAGSATSARIFAEDDGAGNTRLMALFGTGSAKAFAGEDFQTVKSDTTQAGANTDSINNIVTVTQAEYDLLTPDADTVYFITA